MYLNLIKKLDRIIVKHDTAKKGAQSLSPHRGCSTKSARRPLVHPHTNSSARIPQKPPNLPPTILSRFEFQCPSDSFDKYTSFPPSRPVPSLSNTVTRRFRFPLITWHAFQNPTALRISVKVLYMDWASRGSYFRRTHTY